MRLSRPSRCKPAAASTTPSRPPAPTLPIRVSTLPRMSCEPQVGPEGQQLGAAPGAAGAEEGSLRQLLEAAVPRGDQHVAHVGAGRGGGQLEIGGEPRSANP